MTAHGIVTRIAHAPGGREKIGPRPLHVRHRILPAKGRREAGPANSGAEVALIDREHALEMFLDKRDAGVGEWHAAILLSLAVAHHDLAAPDVDVFDPKRHAL